MTARHSEPSSSWVINQAFFSMWVAFAAGISFVAFCLVPSSDVDTPTAMTADAESTLPDAASAILLEPVPNTAPNACQLVVKLREPHAWASDPASSCSSSMCARLLCNVL